MTVRQTDRQTKRQPGKTAGRETQRKQGTGCGTIRKMSDTHALVPVLTVLQGLR